MEVYAEQSIVNENIDRRKTRTKVLRILRYVCIAAVVFLIFMFTMSSVPSEEGANIWAAIGWAALTYLLLIIPFVVAYIMIGKFIKNSNVEYDYYLDGSIFRVVKVFNRKKRKKFIEFKTSAIDSVGRLSSETYDRFASAKEIKKQIAFCEAEQDEDVVYIYYAGEQGKYLLHVTPDEEMSIALRRCVQRMSIIDKSFNAPLRKETPADESGKEEK